MLLVKTIIKSSKIEGLGLFAEEPIVEGQPIWEFNKFIDTLIHQSDFEKLPSTAQEYLTKYAWRHGTIWILCGDNARYVNHSKTPNCFTTPGTTGSFAKEDIFIGEEITENYLDFETNPEDIKFWSSIK